MCALRLPNHRLRIDSLSSPKYPFAFTRESFSIPFLPGVVLLKSHLSIPAFIFCATPPPLAHYALPAPISSFAHGVPCAPIFHRFSCTRTRNVRHSTRLQKCPCCPALLLPTAPLRSLQSACAGLCNLSITSVRDFDPRRVATKYHSIRIASLFRLSALCLFRPPRSFLLLFASVRARALYTL